MELHALPTITETKKKRLGLGHGSGRSKTAGRGTKGQKARGKVPMYRYSGGSLAFVKSLPFLRGKQRNLAWREKPIIITLEKLSLLPKNSIIDIKLLVAHGLVSEKDAASRRIKILGDGGITVPLTVQVPVSKTAAEKIIKAGGVVETKNE
ncbi:MAG TPA: 50S ribosomal protein L15 [Candidatus Saccharimonadales bacterium]|nr:50S ribosomal protein L15 [Candidatus Saccharimonadales bacterium]